MTARTAGDAVGDAGADAPRSGLIAASVFLTAAVALARHQGITPMDRGWCLVAFLGLVGGVSQWLLGAGLAAITRHAVDIPCSHAATQVRTALWNSGTVLVAAADLADLPAGVLVGCVVLITALVLYGRRLRGVGAVRPYTAMSAGYATLLAFLTASVLVGAALAGALPGQ